MIHKTYRLIPIILVFFTASFYATIASAQTGKNHTTVILSLDGFRWDYPTKTATPSMNEIAHDGVKAVSLIPSFPSKTFPNHYTIATGLVPDHHGIVNNSFYDVELDKLYSLSNKDARFNPIFYGGEPIWITAKKQAVKTASFFWVGSDVDNMHPEIWKKYNQQTPFSQRIDTILKWLKRPLAERPRLIMAYYHEPDEVGHHYGPDDKRTLKTVREVDKVVGDFYRRIKQLPNADSINFIIVSDHGMGNISSKRNIALRDYIPKTWPVRIEGGIPIFNLYAPGAWKDSAYASLKKAPHIQVWKPAEVPAYLNYGKNQRVGDIIVVADSAWSVSIARPEKVETGGTHGYDPRDTDMHAIFYAVGPDFKRNYIQPSFQNIHIYPLLAYLLGIQPAKTDGDLKQVVNMLIP